MKGITKFVPLLIHVIAVASPRAITSSWLTVVEDDAHHERDPHRPAEVLAAQDVRERGAPAALEGSGPGRFLLKPHVSSRREDRCHLRVPSSAGGGATPYGVPVGAPTRVA